MTENQIITQTNQEIDTWSLYLYAMKSPITKQKYSKRLEKFFDFLNIEGKDAEQKSIEFVNMPNKEGDSWTFNVILKFMQTLLDRFHKKQITGSTIRNYLKSIKLFCEIADIQIPWKKISRGLPRAKSYSDVDIVNKTSDYQDLITQINSFRDTVKTKSEIIKKLKIQDFLSILFLNLK